MAQRAYLAIDMGASSGRHVAGLFDGSAIELAEMYRFENGPISAAGHLYWDVLGLWKHVGQGLRAAAAKQPSQIVSVGVDTWGVDFALLGANDELLGNPYCYRDSRTDGVMEQAFERVPREEIFAYTGQQFMQINSLYQLLAMKLSNSAILSAAKSFLMMPDVFHWLLTGVKSNELTDASTTQFYNPVEQVWAKRLLEHLGIPTDILCPLANPGTPLGPLRPEVATDTGLSGVKVVLPGTHDTASAVLAVPAAESAQTRPTWCYISSGTWSLMGVEVRQPVITPACLELNFTNEGGVGGTTRLLKNIAGLWLIQECRRIWNQRGNNYGWDDLTRMAAAAPPLASLIDPDHASFLAPSNMPQAIAEFCRGSGQSVPQNEGAVVRTALESLALRYRQVLGWLEQLIGGRIDTIHIVGGGTQNEQLCQWTADACNRRVVAGPVEATALGNVLMQAISAGDIGSISQARELVRASFAVNEYEPQNPAPWDEAFGRFVSLGKA